MDEMTILLSIPLVPRLTVSTLGCGPVGLDTSWLPHRLHAKEHIDEGHVVWLVLGSDHIDVDLERLLPRSFCAYSTMRVVWMQNGWSSRRTVAACTDRPRAIPAGASWSGVAAGKVYSSASKLCPRISRNKASAPACTISSSRKAPTGC